MDNFISILKKTSYISKYDYNGEKCPYMHYKFNMGKNRTVSDNVLEKIVAQFKEKFTPVKSSDINSLMLLRGVGVSKFILLHHYCTGEWPSENMLIKYDVFANIFERGELSFRDQGSSVHGAGGVVFQVSQKYKIGLPVAKGIIRELIKDGKIRALTRSNGKTLLMSSKYYNAEEWLGESMKEVSDDYSLQCDLDGEQKEVVDYILHSRNFIDILQAPAGHGKTYAVSHLIQAFSKVVVACPTGKAAKNFSDEAKSLGAIEFEAMTIHSIYYSLINGGERDIDLLVIDEASMVSSEILGMIKYISDNCEVDKIVLCGDMFQCSPIGCGDIMRDAISIDGDRVQTLHVNHRSKDGDTAKMLNEVRESITNNDLKRVITSIVRSSEFSRGTDSYTVALDEFNSNGVDIVSGDTQLISYTNKSVRELNRAVVVALYGNIASMMYKSRKNTQTPFIGEGMRVFITSNNRKYGSEEISVVNGDIGVVSFNKRDGAKLTKYYQDGATNAGFRDVANIMVNVNIDGRTTSIKYTSACSTMIPAYASTVHKAQGSGYNKAIYVIEKGTDIPVDVLYTGITRAKKHLSVVSVGKGGAGLTVKTKRRTLYTEIYA